MGGASALTLGQSRGLGFRGSGGFRYKKTRGYRDIRSCVALKKYSAKLTVPAEAESPDPVNRQNPTNNLLIYGA